MPQRAQPITRNIRGGVQRTNTQAVARSSQQARPPANAFLKRQPLAGNSIQAQSYSRHQNRSVLIGDTLNHRVDVVRRPVQRPYIQKGIVDSRSNRAQVRQQKGNMFNSQVWEQWNFERKLDQTPALYVKKQASSRNPYLQKTNVQWTRQLKDQVCNEIIQANKNHELRARQQASNINRGTFNGTGVYTKPSEQTAKDLGKYLKEFMPTFQQLDYYATRTKDYQKIMLERERQNRIQNQPQRNRAHVPKVQLPRHPSNQQSYSKDYNSQHLPPHPCQAHPNANQFNPQSMHGFNQPILQNSVPNHLRFSNNYNPPPPVPGYQPLPGPGMDTAHLESNAYYQALLQNSQGFEQSHNGHMPMRNRSHLSSQNGFSQNSQHLINSNQIPYQNLSHISMTNHSEGSNYLPQSQRNAYYC